MNPLFAELMKRATQPLVPAAVTNPITRSLTEPSLTQSPMMARIKGFGAGALDGLRDLTSPLNIAGMLVDDVPLAMGVKALSKIAPAAAEAVGPAAKGFSAVTKMMNPAETKAVTQAATDVLNPKTAGVMEKMYQSAKPTFESMKDAFSGDRTIGGLYGTR